jgi:hypothetical protein
MQDADDPGVDAKEFSVDEKKPGVHEKSSGVDEKVSRVDELNLVQDADVLMQDDSVAPVLLETTFLHAFSLGVMHEEKSEDAFFFGQMHPPAIQHTFSAFVLKQRAPVHKPAVAVDNDDAVQRTAAAGREEDMARHPETCDGGMLRRGRLTG